MTAHRCRWLCFTCIVFLALLFICLAYGRPLEICGVCAPLIWALPLTGSACLMFKTFRTKQLKRVILGFLIFLYFLSTGLHLLQSSVRIRDSYYQSGRHYYVTYEVNPGAMSGISFEQRHYYLILDSEILTIRYLLESKHHDYLG